MCSEPPAAEAEPALPRASLERELVVVLDEADPGVVPQRARDVALEEEGGRRRRRGEVEGPLRVADKVRAGQAEHAELAEAPLAGQLVLADVEEVQAVLAEHAVACCLDVAAPGSGAMRGPNRPETRIYSDICDLDKYIFLHNFVF